MCLVAIVAFRVWLAGCVCMCVGLLVGQAMLGMRNVGWQVVAGWHVQNVGQARLPTC